MRLDYCTISIKYGSVHLFTNGHNGCMCGEELWIL